MRPTLLLLLLPAVQAPDSYETLPYRDNDPFVFCTQGHEQHRARMCWQPLPPFTGQWMPTGVCRPENTYGRPWTARDRHALQLYLRVCPGAGQSGPWQGRGRPEQTPHRH